MGRRFALILDGIPLHLGHLWPPWDRQRRTFADRICAPVVVRAHG